MNEPNHYLSADDRRAATVGAVVELAAEQNPAQITTAVIAQHMGVTQGALFRHFQNKDAILQATMAWVSKRLLARVDRAARGAASPLAALEAIFRTHTDFLAKYPGVPRMVFGQLQRPEKTAAKELVQSMLARYGARVRTLLADGKASGELDAALDVDAAALLFIGTIQGLVMQSLLADDPRRIHTGAAPAFAIYRRGIASAS
ncbi:MAG: TetR/AcrR family transcriptional regulator [Burkholderiaceae bacterium]|nr:MAG: TetR/AcrR family transcriptional regulator [Burkholderiaceae bacterium]